MKRTPLLLTLGFFLLIAGGITLYQYIFNKERISIWNLIPGQTVLVYEIDECEACDGKSSIIPEILEALTLDFSDSTKKSLEVLSIPKRGNAISLHITSKDDLDVIYYYSENYSSQFEQNTSIWKANKERRYTERELNGAKIQEFTFEGKVFSCVQLDKIWVGSFTPFLIEDVIRTFTSGEKSTFIIDVSEVQALPRVKGDPGNFYIHLSNFASWLQIFPEQNFSIPSMGKASLLDIKQEKNSTTLNGFSLAPQAPANSLLSYFNNQSPVQFLLKQYISNRTVFATDYGISDGLSFYKNLDISKNSAIKDTLADLTHVNLETLYSFFGKELVLCFQESKSGSASKTILFETGNPKSWLEFFDQLSKAVEKEDTVFYERYSSYEIREIEINNLPGKLFAPLTSGYTQTYYTSIGNVIILSEKLEEIKQFVDDIDEENVWGKSISFNKFLETTLLESNLSVYINTPLVWNILSNRLNPRWKKFISKNQSLLNSLDLGAIQFSHLNESFYTNLTLTYTDRLPSHQTGPTRKSDRLVVGLNTTISSKPFVVKSHVSKEEEVLVQDSLHTLYFFSSEGKVLWNKALDGPIIDGIKQVDFFKNGKLQFFFATRHKLHVIDRLGNYVAPFPFEINIKDLEFVSLVDYDNSKKYRFLLGDRAGKLWMYDKEIQNLEGWRPKNVGDNLFTRAQHHRLRGKDYILAIRKDGWAHLMNRRGEYIKGFPLNLDARPDGDYFVEIGNSLATTNFVLISKDGFRVKFNLEGKVLSRETLVKPSFETQFSLITDQNKKSYIIKRQDAKRLTILNEEGAEILSNDFVGTSPVSVQYYDFGAGKTFISITDLHQDISFIYNGKGKLLTSTPIEGESIELRFAPSELPKIFATDRNTLVIQ